MGIIWNNEKFQGMANPPKSKSKLDSVKVGS